MLSEINASLYTILIYAFAQLNDNGTLKSLDPWADITKEGYLKFNALKNTNPTLKTLLGIGGWSEGSERFSAMVRTKKTRRVFIQSVLEFLKTYGFDGIDLDWEYPTRRGGKPEDKTNLSLLLKELRKEFDEHGYLLTMAVISGAGSIDSIYEVSSLSKFLDYILLMTYDMHSSANGRTGENAPLRSNDSFNVEFSTKSWIQKGANRAKIILGIPTYGKSFTLTDHKNHGIGAPTKGPGLPGPYSKSNGTLYYFEILQFIKTLGWVREWSDEQLVPFSYNGDQWVGYDDVESVAKKVDFVVDQRLGGIMLWSIDMDDPRGLVGPKFPLTQAIKAKLKQ
ncbi:hypothetical protein RN001_011247 [Aquatica leii]|uniref:GH18 domain-containing protein n=1 Tax=Aquatica leii TaxID=1421715 RepID=A0AAN7PAV7_9COLE|nr:hypothetical protein RN001_011247 [Aquatica leii]